MPRSRPASWPKVCAPGRRSPCAHWRRSQRPRAGGGADGGHDPRNAIVYVIWQTMATPAPACLRAASSPSGGGRPVVAATGGGVARWLQLRVQSWKRQQGHPAQGADRTPCRRPRRNHRRPQGGARKWWRVEPPSWPKVTSFAVAAAQQAMRLQPRARQSAGDRQSRGLSMMNVSSWSIKTRFHR